MITSPLVTYLLAYLLIGSAFFCLELIMRDHANKWRPWITLTFFWLPGIVVYFIWGVVEGIRDIRKERPKDVHFLKASQQHPLERVIYLTDGPTYSRWLVPRPLGEWPE